MPSLCSKPVSALRLSFFSCLSEISMAGVDCSGQNSLYRSTRDGHTGDKSENEFDLMIDTLSSIDNKLNSIDINTRQREDETRTVVRPDSNLVIVYLQISISSIEDIDTVRQEFTCQFYLGVNWEEPQLKDEAKDGRSIEWEKCWEPRIYFQNAVEIMNITSSTKLLQPFYDGNPSVQMSYRVKGRFKTLFDLRAFPFDKQRLEIRIVSKWADSVVQLKETSYKPGYLCCKTFLCEQEWDLYKHVIGTESCTADDCNNDHSLSPNESSRSLETQCKNKIAFLNRSISCVKKGIMKKPVNEGKPLIFSVFTFSFSIRRKYSFFISNVVLLLALISSLALCPFCVPQAEIGDRLSIISTLLLTAVTFKFVVSQSLPRVSYQTLLDQYVLSCIIYIFAMTVIIGVTAKIKFLQQHEPFTVIVTCCSWLAIAIWIVIKSIFTVKSSSMELQRLEDIFSSRNNHSSVFQHIAHSGITDMMIPKLSPDIIPLRISESTAPTVLPRQCQSRAEMQRKVALAASRGRSGEIHTSLARVSRRRRKLKARKGKEKFSLDSCRDNLHESTSLRRKSFAEVSNAQISRFSNSSSSGSSDCHEIVVGRYKVSFDGLTPLSDDSSIEGEVFPQNLGEQRAVENLQMHTRKLAGSRPQTSQG